MGAQSEPEQQAIGYQECAKATPVKKSNKAVVKINLFMEHSITY